MNYYNSRFEIKPGAKRLRPSQKKMKRSQMKRVPGTARLERSPMIRARKPMNKIGRRTKNWRAVWRFLKPELEKRGRTGCEFKFIPHECSQNLTPAHSKKRRLMQGLDIYHVAIACMNVHRILDEQMTHEAMESAVMRAIEEHGGLILPALDSQEG